MAKFAVILPAAGQSRRFGDKNYKKPFIPLGEKPVWLHSAERFLNRPDVTQTIVVIAPEDRELFQMKFGANIAVLGIEVATGGDQRADSVQAALERVQETADFVAVHDAARPCLADTWIDQVFQAAQKSGAAMLAVPIDDTLKRSVTGKTIDETVSRQHLWAAQTPQVFRRDLLLKAYAQRGNGPATDDAQLVERLKHPVTLVRGSRLNLKITTRDDLKLAAAALKAMPKPRLASDGRSPLDDMWR